MKTKTNLLIAAAISFAASGILAAAGFENDIKNIETNLSGYKSGEAIEFAASDPAPVPAGPVGTKWWSVTFFGSTHKYIAKAAIKFINRSSFPDLGAARDILVEGSEDESGHLDGTKNGGPVQELWLGNTPFSKGGVLWNYEHFKFPEAYERIGTIAHLTQDQAVPTHAANIKHGISDSFEGFYGNDVKIEGRRGDGNMEPYEYYQKVQDETRSKLAGWTDPDTGRMYWVPAADAPRFGEDATYGSWGHYGGKHDWDVWAVPPPNSNSSHGGNNNGPWVTKHPEIRLQQMAVAGAATISVFESASKRLPPLVQNLSVSTVAFDSTEGPRVGYSINFNAYDNRSSQLTVEVSVYKDGERLGTAAGGAMTLAAPQKDGIMFSGALRMSWAGMVDDRYLPAGNYTLDVRLTDEDGNVTPDSVNSDDIRENDTKVTIAIP